MCFGAVRQVTHVLSLGGAAMLAPLRVRYAALGLQHLAIEVTDASTSDLASVFDACFAFVAEGLAAASGGGVLVHCFQGKSRSAGARLV
jgi:protein-tyrosine phosphatase